MLSFTRLSSARLLRIRVNRVPSSSLLRPRYFASPPPQTSSSTLPIERYHALSDETMDNLLHSLEELVDSVGTSGYEVEYHSASQQANMAVFAIQWSKTIRLH
uniref:Mitochondrial iron uptake protein n=1 Tax=Mycena chlorophos TaxID=658473 RepID=A0ABQ0L9T1_MYCCL|nr:mitochondrial iron uptake protein [Mycena chlorophos]